MKIKSTFFSVILFATFLSFQSCSDDDSDERDNANAGCADFEADYNEISETLAAFSQNPSPETCEAYKNALLEFYDNYNDCPYWGDYYQEAYDEIQAMNCSEIETS